MKRKNNLWASYQLYHPEDDGHTYFQETCPDSTCLLINPLSRNMVRRAFTLIEVMVTIAIIMILSAIIFAVYARGKNSAATTDIISRMRQIGQSAALYEETFGSRPQTVIDLVNAGSIKKDFVSFNRDQSSRGLAYFALVDSYLGEKVPDYPDWKISFPSLFECRITPIEQQAWLTSEYAGGWLIDISDSEYKPNAPITAGSGLYRRLLFDTSVQVRQHKDLLPETDPTLGALRTPTMLFADIDEDYVRWVNNLGS